MSLTLRLIVLFVVTLIRHRLTVIATNFTGSFSPPFVHGLYTGRSTNISLLVNASNIAVSDCASTTLTLRVGCVDVKICSITPSTFEVFPIVNSSISRSECVWEAPRLVLNAKFLGRTRLRLELLEITTSDVTDADHRYDRSIIN